VIRVAFTLIGGKNWVGGYNYLLNLVRALADHAPDRVQPVLFFGTDVANDEIAPFAAIAGAQVLQAEAFDEKNKKRRLREALLLGCDRVAVHHFAKQRINLAFENAQFYGWRFPFPCVGWIPDFQHKRLRQLFNTAGYWKRELGFQAQVFSGRSIMLSSDDARKDCEQFYPDTVGRTDVVRFAVPSVNVLNANEARAVADSYGLPEVFYYLPNQFYRHKNHECVVRALHLLKQRGRKIVVAASGKQADPRDATYFPQLKGLIESLGVSQEFRMLGLIPHEHIPALMRSCAAMINPSTFEGWSTTVEEAKAMGTPMLLSNLGVHIEQAQGTVVFFDTQKFEQLANALENYAPLDSAQRQQLFDEAAVDAAARVAQFAADFARVAERAELQNNRKMQPKTGRESR
jgi:glycosyltransferase involved in cell wall biosynthesis